MLNDIQIISIGQIIRDEIKKGTKLGEEIINSKKAGLMAPDNIINKILENELRASRAQLIVLDGYPRSTSQLDSLFKLIKDENFDMIYRETDIDTIKERIALRRICESCGKEQDISEQTTLNTCLCGGNLVKRREDLIWESRLEEFNLVTRPAIKLAQDIARKEINNLKFHKLPNCDLNSQEGKEIISKLVQECFIKKYGD